MWEKQTKKSYAGVSKEAIWKVLSDVEGWPRWNLDMESCRLKGKFEEGGTFEIKGKNLPSVTLTIEKIVENSCLIDCAHLPGAKMYGKHEIFETEEGVELVTTISITGLNSKMWVSILGEKVSGKSAKQMDDLVLRAGNSGLPI
jgi:hypothetical protein